MTTADLKTLIETHVEKEHQKPILLKLHQVMTKAFLLGKFQGMRMHWDNSSRDEMLDEIEELLKELSG